MARKHFSAMALACMLQMGWLLLPKAAAQASAASIAPTTPTLKTRAAHEHQPATKGQRAISAQALQVYRRAVHELHQGETAAATKDAQRAIHLDENFADAYALSATAALIERNYPLAQAEAAQATQIDPQDKKAWVVAATADNYLGQFAKAAEALGHIPEQDQEAWQVAYQWARAEAGRQHAQQALEWSNRAALTAPSTFAPLHLLRASALLAANQYALSADELEAYLSLIAPDAPQHSELAVELRKLRALERNGVETQSSSEANTPEYNALAN